MEFCINCFRDLVSTPKHFNRVWTEELLACVSIWTIGPHVLNTRFINICHVKSGGHCGDNKLSHECVSYGYN